MIWSVNQPHTVETYLEKLYWDGLLNSGAKLHGELYFRHEAIMDTFSVGSVDIAPAKYNFLNSTLSFNSSTGNKFRYDLKATYGGYFGGQQLQIIASPAWTIDEHITFSLNYEFDRIIVDQNRFTAHLTRFRVQSALNNAISFNAFIQHNSELHEVSTNVRLRFNPAEGNDFFLVYNENLNTTLQTEDELLPYLPRSKNRTVLVKYNYTFVH